MKTRGGWSETSTHKHTGAANGEPAGLGGEPSFAATHRSDRAESGITRHRSAARKGDPSGATPAILLNARRTQSSQAVCLESVFPGEELFFRQLVDLASLLIRKECGPGTDPKLRHNLGSLFTAGRLYLDDELWLRFVSGPGRSGNQIHVVIDPKRVKPYVSLNPLFL